MKIFIFVGLISITFAQSFGGYEGGGDEETYQEVPDDGYSGGYAGEGSYGQGANPYAGANLAQLARALGGRGVEATGYEGAGYGGQSYGGADAASYGQQGLGDGGEQGSYGGYGGDEGGEGGQHSPGMQDMASLYAQAAAGAGGEGLEALSGAFGGGDSY